MKMPTKYRMRIAAIALFASGSATADLNDGNYFNLLLGTDTATSGSTIQLCGQQSCTGTDSIGLGIFTALPKNAPAGSGNPNDYNVFLRFENNVGKEYNGSNPTEAAFNSGLPDQGGFFNGLILNGNGYESGTPGGKDGWQTNQAKDSDGGGSGDSDFNHVLRLSDLLVGDNEYITFKLDINEPSEAGKTTILLDELAFFISTDENLKYFARDTTGDANNSDLPPVGTFVADDSPLCTTTPSAPECKVNVARVWDMDYDKLSGTGKGGLILNNSNNGPAGSGDFDMSVQISKKLFQQRLADIKADAKDAYVYLYNFMGNADTKDTTCGTGKTQICDAEAGFEEWVVMNEVAPPPPGGGGGGVPEPGTAFLLGAGLFGMTRIRRQRASAC